MSQRKIEAREIRLAQARARAEEYKELLRKKGLDENHISRNSTMRRLLAEVRKLKRSLEALRWEPPKTTPAEKAEKSEKPEKPEKPAKEAAPPKAPKAPKEKKPKTEPPPAQ